MSMFSQIQSEPTCTTVEECVQRDKVADNLWTWANRLEGFGIVLGLILLVVGLIVSWQSATISSGWRTEFDWGIFWASLVSWMLYAFIGYCLYHAVALLIGALAGIYQNTKATARLQEYRLRNLATEEAAGSRSAQSAKTASGAQVEREEAVPPQAVPSEAPHGHGRVRCPQCGTPQGDTREKCYQCGATLP